MSRILVGARWLPVVATALLACGTAVSNDVAPPLDAGMGANVGQPACPPDGPFGRDLNQAIPNVALADCDGNPVELHDLCARKVAYFFVYADW